MPISCPATSSCSTKLTWQLTHLNPAWLHSTSVFANFCCTCRHVGSIHLTGATGCSSGLQQEGQKLIRGILAQSSSSQHTHMPKPKTCGSSPPAPVHTYWIIPEVHASDADSKFGTDQLLIYSSWASSVLATCNVSDDVANTLQYKLSMYILRDWVW